jgi:gas vesicle protein
MEASVRTKSEVLAAAAIGAVVGAAAGYLFFTERGRTLRRQLEPAIDDFSRELSHFRGTVMKAAGVAGDGWKLLNEALGETGSQPPRYPTSRQSSPF